LRNNEVEKLEFKWKENGGGAGGARSSAALRSVLLSLVQPGTPAFLFASSSSGFHAAASIFVKPPSP
jgi:hypothetical protein